MPSGTHLSATYLAQIWYARIILQRSTAVIFENIFRSDESFISVNYLRSLCLRCDSSDHDEKFFGAKLPRSGGPHHIIDDFDAFIFLAMFREKPQTTLICEDHYDAINGVPSIRSFGRLLRRNNVTRKV